ncbi:hypothetical protein DFJ74DRAFT_713828 [Hyaloraphidium curvatum]|nr:hypothetical protein DFJ74DRAFT_713828 [Hyaloraphidium curvatum]
MGACCSTSEPVSAPAPPAPAKPAPRAEPAAAPAVESDYLAGAAPASLPPAYSDIPLHATSGAQAPAGPAAADDNPFLRPGGVKGVDIKLPQAFGDPSSSAVSAAPAATSSASSEKPKTKPAPAPVVEEGPTRPFDVAVCSDDMIAAYYTPAQLLGAIRSLEADGKWYGGPKNYFSPPGAAIEDWREGMAEVDLDTAAVAISRRLSGADKNDDRPQPEDEADGYEDPYAEDEEKAEEEEPRKKGKATVIIGPGVIFRGNVEINGDVQMHGKVTMDGETGQLRVERKD